MVFRIHILVPLNKTRTFIGRSIAPRYLESFFPADASSGVFNARPVGRTEGTRWKHQRHAAFLSSVEDVPQVRGRGLVQGRHGVKLAQREEVPGEVQGTSGAVPQGGGPAETAASQDDRGKHVSAGVAQQNSVGGGDQQVAVRETDQGRIVFRRRIDCRTDGQVRGLLGVDRRRRCDWRRYFRVCWRTAVGHFAPDSGAVVFDEKKFVFKKYNKKNV